MQESTKEQSRKICKEGSKELGKRVHKKSTRNQETVLAKM